MRDQPRDDRPRPAPDARLGLRPGDRGRAGRRVRIADSVRLNRYLAAAGLGTRREVEGYIRRGRVTLDGTVVEDPAVQVHADVVVALDLEPLRAAHDAGIALHKPAGAPLALIHPPGLVPVLPLDEAVGGLELLVADRRLARGLAEPGIALPRHDHSGRRVTLAGIPLDELAPGTWRPLAPREREHCWRIVRAGPRRAQV